MASYSIIMKTTQHVFYIASHPGGTGGLLLDLDKNKLYFFSNQQKVGEVTIPHDTYYPAFDTLQTTSQITLIQDPQLPDSISEWTDFEV